LPKKQTTSGGPKHNTPGKLSGNFRVCKLETIVGGGEKKKSILQDSVKCVLHIKSEVKLDTFVNLHGSASQRVLFGEIPFSEELLDYLHAVSGSEA